MTASDNPWLALLFCTVAFLAACLAFVLAVRGQRPEGDTGRRWAVTAALVMGLGLGVGAMHLLGALALHLPGHVPHDVAIVLVAILPAVAASWVALRLAHRRRVDADMLARATELAAAMNADALANEAHKRAIVESSLDGIITIDRLGRVIEFNAAAEHIFGYRRDQVLGWPLSECIVPPAMRAQHEEGFARMLEGGPSLLLGRRIEIIAMRRSGQEFPIELALTRTPIGGEPAFTAHLRDLTERRAAEHSLRLRGLALVRRVTADGAQAAVDKAFKP